MSLTRRQLKNAAIFFTAAIMNGSLFYAFSILEYLRSGRYEAAVPQKEVAVSTIQVAANEEKEKPKRKMLETAKLRQSDSSKASSRFEMSFGEGMGGSGAALASQSIEGAVYKEGQVDSEPVIISKVVPSTPVEAQNAGIHGKVVIRVVISETGSVIQAVYYSGDPDHGFKEAAIEALRNWQFKPAVYQGVPVKFEYLVPFSF